MCVDVAVVTEGAGCPACEGALHLRRGIEVGNIFQLGTDYSVSMGMTFTDATGKACFPFMGCYGIGMGRLMSAVMEAHRDSYGPKWPMSVAPWQVHLNALKRSKPAVSECAERLYEQLQSAGVEVVYDDRDATPGVQFADADLLGVPIRLIVSERNLSTGVVEYKRRDTGETGTVPPEDALPAVRQWIADALRSEI
jgi:prolyl-tRNA synthetase